MNFDYEKIHKFPYPIPDEIIDSLSRNKLAFFIGAGVSRIIGCKGWEDFASNLLNECKKRKYIDHLEYESLKQEKDLKKIITIAHSIFDEKKEEIEFINLFKNSLQSDSSLKEEYDIYTLLKKFEAVYVTTNADSHFDSFFTEKNRICNFTKDMKIEREKLYHIHGMESQPESLVFTIDQYLDQYNKEDFRNFLIKLFSEYTIIFVGYGLGEYEVLDFLFEKAHFATSNELRHFFIKAFFSHEGYMLKHEQRYFRRLGVNVVGYEKNALGFTELYKLLESWEREYLLSTKMIPDKLEDIEMKILTVETEKEIDELIKLIESRNLFKKHFIRCLWSNIILAPKFFDYFIKNNYFSQENNPPIKEVENNPGYFSIPYWDMLEYLLIMKNYLGQQQNNREIIENLKIVLNNLIINYSENRNYNTDRVLIILIFSLSEVDIENSYIKFLRTALESKFNNTVISGTIYENAIPACINYTNDKIIEILEIILDMKEVDNVYKKLPLLDRHYLLQLIREYVDAFFEKIENKLIDIILNKLEKMSDAKFPLLLLDQLFTNITKEQIDGLEYDQMLVVALFYLLNKLSNTERNNYIEKINKNNSPLFKRISNLIKTATEKKVIKNENTWTNFVSPYSAEELLKMSTEDICKAISTINIELPEHRWNAPCQIGFSESLNDMIAKAPNKITDFYQEYLQIPIRYKNDILSSLLNNAKNKISMDWENIFCLSEKIIHSYDFADIQNEQSKFICDIFSNTSELIYSYFNGYVVNENFYDGLKEQLFYILSKTNSTDLPSNIDSSILEGTIDKTYCAIMKLTIYYGKNHDTDTNKWDKEIFDHLYKLLDSDSASLVLCSVFGEYFPVFLWLNKEYIFSKFDLIMQNKSNEQWESFILGFFNSSFAFNNDAFNLLRKNNIYDKFITQKENFASFSKVRMIEHICIAYFRKLDDIDNKDSLLRKIILNGDKNDINSIVDFVWRQKEYFKPKKDNYVKKLWEIIVDCLPYEKFSNDRESCNVIVKLLSFLSVIEIVDKEVVRYIEFSIKYCNESNLPFFIISDLTVLFKIESNRENILTILDMFIKRNILFLYQEKEVKNFVKQLHEYNLGYASRICNAYLERGYNFLSDLCKK